VQPQLWHLISARSVQVHQGQHPLGSIGSSCGLPDGPIIQAPCSHICTHHPPQTQHQPVQLSESPAPLGLPFPMESQGPRGIKCAPCSQGHTPSCWHYFIQFTWLHRCFWQNSQADTSYLAVARNARTIPHL
jgi:hypothetical protein